MTFDFGKFSNMDAKTIDKAFGASEEQKIVADMGREIAQTVKQPEVVPTTTTNLNLQGVTPEQLKQQAEALKQANAKDEVKEDSKQDSKKSSKKESKKDSKKGSKTNTKKKEETPIVFSRPRRVCAYGEEVYIEQNTNATLEDIRRVLVETYGYSEFREPDRCTMIFDAKTGMVYPHIEFKKKG